MPPLDIAPTRGNLNSEAILGLRLNLPPHTVRKRFVVHEGDNHVDNGMHRYRTLGGKAIPLIIFEQGRANKPGVQGMDPDSVIVEQGFRNRSHKRDRICL